MVKLSLMHADWLPIQGDVVIEWLEETLGEITVANGDPSELDPGDLDHHFYQGNDVWQYHYIRTTLFPADEDLDVYVRKYDIDRAQTFYTAWYITLPDEVTLVQMRLTLSGGGWHDS
jgi:hypothetical protein